jgi:hypothetical protein
MAKHQDTTQKQSVTILLNQETHEQLGEAAHQLRESQTKLASFAILHYLNHLKKTKQYKPSTHKVEGFAV